MRLPQHLPGALAARRRRVRPRLRAGQDHALAARHPGGRRRHPRACRRSRRRMRPAPRSSANAGSKVRLVPRPFPQPLGRRRFTEVWRRQLRWARLRRVSFSCSSIRRSLRAASSRSPWPASLASAGAIPVSARAGAGRRLWYGAEALLAATLGWPLSWRSLALWILRDLMLPVPLARSDVRQRLRLARQRDDRRRRARDARPSARGGIGRRGLPLVSQPERLRDQVHKSGGGRRARG